MAKELTFYISNFNFLVLQRLGKITIISDIGLQIDKNGNKYKVFYAKIKDKEKIVKVF